MSTVNDVQTLNDWSLSDDQKSINKSFEFKDFEKTWSFMQAVADKADAMDHHPDWRNVYNWVDITLSTHCDGSLSDKDITLARFIDSLTITNDS